MKYRLALAWAIALALALSAFALPSIGDPTSVVTSDRAFAPATGLRNTWSAEQPDGWTVSATDDEGTIVRIDWWKTGSVAECQAQFIRALDRMGADREAVVMLAQWEAVFVKVRGELIIATVLSVSPYKGVYVMERSDVLVGRLP